MIAVLLLLLLFGECYLEYVCVCVCLSVCVCGEFVVSWKQKRGEIKLLF